MRAEVSAGGSTLNAKELREALLCVDDAAPVYFQGFPVLLAVGEDLRLDLDGELEAGEDW